MAKLSTAMTQALTALSVGFQPSRAKLTTMWALQRRGLAEFDRPSLKWRITDAGRAALKGN